MRERLRKLLCFVFGHLDDVTGVRTHLLSCKCHGGGGHGEFDYTCKRCKREKTRIELIC